MTNEGLKKKLVYRSALRRLKGHITVVVELVKGRTGVLHIKHPEISCHHRDSGMELDHVTYVEIDLEGSRSIVRPMTVYGEDGSDHVADGRYCQGCQRSVTYLAHRRLGNKWWDPNANPIQDLWDLAKSMEESGNHYV